MTTEESSLCGPMTIVCRSLCGTMTIVCQHVAWDDATHTRNQATTTEIKGLSMPKNSSISLCLSLPFFNFYSFISKAQVEEITQDLRRITVFW